MTQRIPKTEINKNNIVSQIIKDYSLTLRALNDNKEGLIAKQVADITGREVRYEGNRLYKFFRAGLLQREGNRYILTKENKEELKDTFGPNAFPFLE